MLEVLNGNIEAVAIAAVRIILGLLFIFQAYDKIFSVGLKEFTATVTTGDKLTRIPKGFIMFSTAVSSYIELIAGALLIIGVFLPWAYLILAVNLVMVTFAFSYVRPLWNMEFFFPRMVMLVFLMMTPLDHDLFSLGAYLG